MHKPRAPRPRADRPEATHASRRPHPGRARPEAPPRNEPPVPAREEPKRSLSHVGGPTSSHGDEAEVAVLQRALDVRGALEDDAGDATRRHIHGFHTYPARMHPETARELVVGLSRPGAVVLDPFCGSGTVLIEARAAGRRALGTDINPLAIRLAKRKVESASDAELDATLGEAEAVAAVATERRLKRAGASRRYGREDVELFDAHVLLELDGLRVGLEELKQRSPGRVHETLSLVLSSILVKLSKQRGDTSGGRREVRLAAGYPSRLFVKKTEELCRQLHEAGALYGDAPAASVVLDDARKLTALRSASVDLVVSSPPYPGVYDYVEHHRLRLRWLGLPTKGFEQGEIGARRSFNRLAVEEARAAFTEQMIDVLRATHRVLVPGGRLVFLIADGAIGDHPVESDRVLEDAAGESGFEVSAACSQARPHFHFGSRNAFRGRERYEHAIVLRKIGRAGPPRSTKRGRTR